MAYILSDKEDKRNEECVFCIKLAEDRDAENYVVWRGAHCAIVLNLYPYNNGHLMIIPYTHVPSLEDLPVEAQTEMMATVSKSLRLLRRAMQPQGFNVGANIGSLTFTSTSCLAGKEIRTLCLYWPKHASSQSGSTIPTPI
jgi:ATP adenylyltransferase